mgnify:CR=1 FL=1
MNDNVTPIDAKTRAAVLEMMEPLLGPDPLVVMRKADFEMLRDSLKVCLEAIDEAHRQESFTHEQRKVLMSLMDFHADDPPDEYYSDAAFAELQELFAQGGPPNGLPSPAWHWWRAAREALAKAQAITG